MAKQILLELETRADGLYLSGNLQAARLEYLRLFREISRAKFLALRLLVPFSLERKLFLKSCDRLAQLYYQDSNYERALFFLTRSARFGESNDQKSRRAFCLLRCGMADQSSMELIRRMYPFPGEDNRPLLPPLYALLKRTGDYSEFAYRVAGDYFRTDPGLTDSDLDYLGELVVRQPIPYTDSGLAEMVFRSSGSEKLSGLLAEHYIVRNDFREQAFLLVKKLYEKNGSLEFLSFMGQYYSNRKIFNDESFEIFLRIYETAGEKDSENLLALGESLLKKNARDDFARLIYESVAAHFGSHMENLKTLALLYAENGKHDAQALVIYEKTSYYLKENPVFMKAIVNAYLKAGVFTAQSQWCARQLLAMEQEPYPEALFLAARTDLVHGRKREALGLLEKLERIIDRERNTTLMRQFLLILHSLRLPMMNSAEMDRSIAEMESVFGKSPVDPDAALLLGDMYFRITPDFQKLDCNFDDRMCMVNFNQCTLDFSEKVEAKRSLDLYLMALEKRQSPEMYYKTGRGYLFIGMKKLALEFLNKAKDLSPGSAPVICLLARLKAEFGEIDEAVRDLQKLLNDNAEHAGVFHQLLSLLWQQEYWDEGIDYASKALKRFPEQAMLHFWRGRFFRAKDWLKTAAIDLEQALSLHDCEEYACELAECFLSMDMTAKGLSVLQKYDGERSLWLKIMLYYGKDDRSARLLLEEYTTRFDSRAEAWLMLGNLRWQLESDEQSLNYFDKAVSLTGPQDELRQEALFQKASVLFHLRRYNDSRKLIHEHLRLMSATEPKVIRLCAMLNFKFNDFNAVVAEINRLPEDQKGIEENLLLSKAYKEMGRHEVAAGILEGILEGNSEQWEILKELAEVYEESGSLERAQECFLQLYSRKYDLDSARSLVRVYLKFHDFKKALQLIEAEKLEEFYSFRDKAYFQLGEFDKIVEFRTLQVSPEEIRSFSGFDNFIVIQEQLEGLILSRYKGHLLLDRMPVKKDDWQRITAFLSDRDGHALTETVISDSVLPVPMTSLSELAGTFFPHLTISGVEEFLARHYKEADGPLSFRLFRFLQEFSDQMRGFLFSTGMLPESMKKCLPFSENKPDCDDFISELEQAKTRWFHSPELKPESGLRDPGSSRIIELVPERFPVLFRFFKPGSRIGGMRLFSREMMNLAYTAAISGDRLWAAALFQACFTAFPPDVFPNRFSVRLKILNCGKPDQDSGLVFALPGECSNPDLTFDVEELYYRMNSECFVNLETTADLCRVVSDFAVNWIAKHKVLRINREIKKTAQELRQMRRILALPPQIVLRPVHKTTTDWRRLNQRLERIFRQLSALTPDSFSHEMCDLVWGEVSKCREELGNLNLRLREWKSGFLVVDCGQGRLSCCFYPETPVPLPERRVFWDFDDEFYAMQSGDACQVRTAGEEEHLPNLISSGDTSLPAGENDFRFDYHRGTLIKDSRPFPLRFEERLFLYGHFNNCSGSARMYSLKRFINRVCRMDPACRICVSPSVQSYLTGMNPVFPDASHTTGDDLVARRANFLFPELSAFPSEYMRLLKAETAVATGLPYFNLFYLHASEGNTLVLSGHSDIYRRISWLYNLFMDYSLVFCETADDFIRAGSTPGAKTVVASFEVLAQEGTFMPAAGREWERLIILDSDRLLYYSTDFSYVFLLVVKRLKALHFWKTIFALARYDDSACGLLAREAGLPEQVLQVPLYQGSKKFALNPLASGSGSIEISAKADMDQALLFHQAESIILTEYFPGCELGPICAAFNGIRFQISGKSWLPKLSPPGRAKLFRVLRDLNGGEQPDPGQDLLSYISVAGGWAEAVLSAG
ncbi:MAG: hypothetical protein PHQ23_11395, partial [Candidatus Wallbacteria bacterium]|nr:hypothetical protein [Candidatus Wallbacteria bacterium]